MMNGTNRHFQYRRNLQRKRRRRRILLLSGIVLVLLVIGFLLLGWLSSGAKDQAEENPSADTENGSAHELPASVKAYPLSLESADASSIATRVQELRQRPAKDASVVLNRADGTLLYTSDLSSSLGIHSSEASVTLARLSSQAKANQVRLSGVWYLSAFREKDAILRSVRLSETAALLADALQNGMDDILLMAPDLTADSMEELLLLSDTVHRLYPDGMLGICIPSAFLNSADSLILTDRLVEGFDFLAVNATEITASESTVQHVQSVAHSNMELLLRYNARLILPHAADPAQEAEIIAAAEQYSTKSWQILY